MRTRQFPMILVGILLAFGGAACTRVQGSGIAVEDKRDVPTFFEVEARDSASVVLTVQPSSAGTPTSVEVTVSGDDNIVPYVETAVVGGVLQVGFRDNMLLDTSVPLRVTATVPKLLASRSWDSANVKVSGLQNESFSVEAADSSDVELSGKTGALTIASADSADINARNLEAGDVTVRGKDSSDIKVCARGALEVEASDSADVTYFCAPASVERKVSDSADVHAGP
jgi:hypothetical protein